MAHVKKQMISFFVTTSCNLSCRYCYTNKNENEHRNQKLNFNFAKYAIDEYFANTNNRHIRFFGAGEPTTEFSLLKKIYDYAHTKSNGSLTAEIQTNGVFTLEIANWLADNVNIIWISSDGFPDLQDYYRCTSTGKATSKILEKNIKYLIQNSNVEGMLGIRSTISEKSIRKQKQLVDYFQSLGINYIWSDPVFPAVGEENDKHNPFNYQLYVREFLEAREYAEKLGVFYGTFLACNFDEETDYNCRACTPVPHLTTDGYVSACDMALFGELKNSEKQMSPFIYGKWDTKNKKIIYYKDKIELLRERKGINMLGCKGCEALKYCAGYCLGEVTNESGSMFGKKPQVCDSIRYLLNNMDISKLRYKYLHP